MARGPLPNAGSNPIFFIKTIIIRAVKLVKRSEMKVAREITNAVNGCFQSNEMPKNIIIPIMIAITNAIAVCFKKYFFRLSSLPMIAKSRTKRVWC